MLSRPPTWPTSDPWVNRGPRKHATQPGIVIVNVKINSRDAIAERFVHAPLSRRGFTGGLSMRVSLIAGAAIALLLLALPVGAQKDSASHLYQIELDKTAGGVRLLRHDNKLLV